MHPNKLTLKQLIKLNKTERKKELVYLKAKYPEIYKTK